MDSIVLEREVNCDLPTDRNPGVDLVIEFSEIEREVIECDLGVICPQ